MIYGHQISWKNNSIFLKSNPDIGICGTWGIKRYRSGKELQWEMPVNDQEIRVRMIWWCPIIHSSMIIRSSVINNNNIRYDTDFANSEDFELIRKVILHTKAHNLNENLVTYNLHNNQISSLNNKTQILNAVIICEKYLKDLNIVMNKKQKDIILKLKNYKFTLDVKELEELKALFKDLLGVPDKNFTRLLRDDLSEQWFTACYFSSQSGIQTIQIFNSAQIELPYKPGILKKIKFYIKCLLKK